ncbi:hypothetical protein CB1_000155019 [Camelus ferus]|nr:hypothetical protein CB1_000155019 [Camelus ferus]
MPGCLGTGSRQTRRSSVPDLYRSEHRQLQKMVHDIKNNEGGIMNKIKKLKVKAPPSVPRRDYASESPADEEERWSDDFDSDYENPDEHSDSEMYALPAEEAGDDSYEPPPAEQETRTVHPALPFTRGEYVVLLSLWVSIAPWEHIFDEDILLVFVTSKQRSLGLQVNFFTCCTVPTAQSRECFKLD